MITKNTYSTAIHTVISSCSLQYSAYSRVPPDHTISFVTPWPADHDRCAGMTALHKRGLIFRLPLLVHRLDMSGGDAKIKHQQLVVMRVKRSYSAGLLLLASGWSFQQDRDSWSKPTVPPTTGLIFEYINKESCPLKWQQPGYPQKSADSLTHSVHGRTVEIAGISVFLSKSRVESRELYI